MTGRTAVPSAVKATAERCMQTIQLTLLPQAASFVQGQHKNATLACLVKTKWQGQIVIWTRRLYIAPLTLGLLYECGYRWAPPAKVHFVLSPHPHACERNHTPATCRMGMESAAKPPILQNLKQLFKKLNYRMGATEECTCRQLR
jgi:hypothetical protein